MTSFQKRNPLVIGVLSLVAIVGLAGMAYYADDLPVVGGGVTYTADFGEAAGLKARNEVRVAGVKVGEVKAVELNGNQVKVSFKVKDTWLGDQTTAAIQIKTLLGEKYLALDPVGSKQLSSANPIPRNRTLTPFDVTDAFQQLASTTEQINTDQLAKSFETLSGTFQGATPEVKGALTGLSALSKTISSRDQQLRQLFGNTRAISQTVSDRDAQFQKLLVDGNVLLADVQQRKASITALLQGTQELSKQLDGLVSDNRAQLKPALDELNKVTTILRANQDNLGKTIQGMAPYVRLINNTVGNGRWFDVYNCALLPPALDFGFTTVNPQGCPGNPATQGGGR